jgi:hypothetical protein
MPNKVINKLIKLAGVYFLVFLHPLVYAATGPGITKSIFDLMSYQEVLDMTIETDLDSIRAKRRTMKDLETVISFRDAQGNLQRWEADLSIRGKFRRVHCYVPPLKLDFKKSQLAEAGLNDYDDLDIVAHCLEDDMLAKELVIKEYLAYKLYNRITDYSYRVQLVRITYRNPESGKEAQQWGFLIEDTAQLSARIGAEKVERIGLPVEAFHQEYLKIIAVFQHMIGNADWDLKIARNVKFFQKDGKIIPIVYDFDFSGLVDAPYATFRPNDTLRFVFPNIYLGLPAAETNLKPTLQYFRSKRKSLLSIVRKLKILSSDHRKTAIGYLKAFFIYVDHVTEKETRI